MGIITVLSIWENVSFERCGKQILNRKYMEE
ncbi:hypothetical protein GGR21_002476 [Dysgonomonas hofstadii]|uniref:Uncharacterized protein n=1 Tax=Dysgonomonas hofstadii TaxID=637886 RepID=A0A840CKR3_9BACT|nr:hypothetical protein [Dysgonomonas hofstadii]